MAAIVIEVLRWFLEVAFFFSCTLRLMYCSEHHVSLVFFYEGDFFFQWGRDCLARCRWVAGGKKEKGIILYSPGITSFFLSA